MFSNILLYVELCHRSLERSSAKRATLSEKLFRAAIVARIALALASSRCRCFETKSPSRDSTTAERLSVIPRACVTRSSFSVNLTARLRAARSYGLLICERSNAHKVRFATSLFAASMSARTQAAQSRLRRCGRRSGAVCATAAPASMFLEIDRRRSSRRGTQKSIKALSLSGTRRLLA